MRGWVWFTAHECMVEDWAVINLFITEENDLPGLQNRFLGLGIMIMGAKTKFVQCPDGELQKRKESGQRSIAVGTKIKTTKCHRSESQPSAERTRNRLTGSLSISLTVFSSSQLNLTRMRT
ncbi:unnamed protein product [Brassica rapa]|uniref:Uncharacterized protein n=2 Tax=Brassica TaxID=3705 RepID=A0A8D9CSG8_BRACM|nr:unnamed protein product [Brassica napus]CAG7860502.1 unnamed protein product [Brassica rapa]